MSDRQVQDLIAEISLAKLRKVRRVRDRRRGRPSGRIAARDRTTAPTSLPEPEREPA